MLLAVNVAAGVLRTAGPLHHACAAHHAVLPLAFVGPAVLEPVGAIAVHPVVPELPLVRSTVRHGPLATAVLRPFQEPPSVQRAVGPRLDALTRLLVVDPLAIVGAAIGMDIRAISVHLVLLPLPF